jgi:hypothetical protein
MLGEKFEHLGPPGDTDGAFAMVVPMARRSLVPLWARLSLGGVGSFLCFVAVRMDVGSAGSAEEQDEGG